MIKEAKESLDKNLLEKVECIYCEWAKTKGELPEKIKKDIIASYHDVRNYYFHCDDLKHLNAFHKVVGPLSTFSCSCKDRYGHKQGESYNVYEENDFEDVGDSDNDNETKDSLLDMFKPIFMD